MSVAFYVTVEPANVDPPNAVIQLSIRPFLLFTFLFLLTFVQGA